MGMIVLWLAGFGIPGDVLENAKLKTEIKACDGHAAYETLSRELVRKGYLTGYDETRGPGPHLEFAILVERFGNQP